jgi:3-oxoacyl-[acyl-carrier-protein] synthase II
VSGATGAAPATAQEQAFLARHPWQAVRATGGLLGHGLEPQFPMNIALAALALKHRQIFPPHDTSGFERAGGGAVERVLVTAVGHWRGEGLALVEAVG